MTSQSKAVAPSPPRGLYVGVYGCTKAGKTRFLFELLRNWEQSRRILVASPSCQQFLKTVEGEIEKHGDSMPTAAVSAEITVTIDRGDKEPDWQVTFRDLRGELLTDELDGDIALLREGMVSSQVAKCDAFLFFFDPSASSTKAAMQEHHECELNRAELFIAHVLEHRQNDYLPIAFVHTHADVWLGDAEVVSASQRWRERVHESLARQYKRLHGHRPQCLTDTNRVFFETAAAKASAESKKQLEFVVEQLLDSAKACASFKEKDSKGMTSIVVAVGVLMVGIVAGGLWLLLSPPPPPGPSGSNGRPRSARAELPKTDRQASSKAKEVQAFIRSLPTGVQIPEESDAIEIKDALRWLCRECDPTQSTSQTRPAEIHENLVSVLREASRYLLALTTRDGLGAKEKCGFLAKSLEGVPDGIALGIDELSSAQEAFWNLEGATLTSTVAEILRRRADVESPAAQTLDELVGELKTRKDTWSGNGIAPTRVGKAAVDRLQAALTFCEDQRKSGIYAADISVDASQSLGGQAPLEPRILRISTPGQNPTNQVEEIHLTPNDGQVPLDISAKVEWGPDCWNDHENTVFLTCANMEHRNDRVKSSTGKTDTLKPFRATLLQDKAVEIKARIEVTDSVFLVSSRSHGKGTLECSVSDLLRSPQEMPLSGAGAGGNRIVFTATTPTPDQRNGFHTERPDYHHIFRHGSPIDCQVVLATSDRTLQHSFDAAKDPGPLESIGLPLLRERAKTEAKYCYEQDGFKIDVTFLNLPVVPELLWDAALSPRAAP